MTRSPARLALAASALLALAILALAALYAGAWGRALYAWWQGVAG